VRLLLIRHGQTPSNVAGELDTAPPGAELTALGRRQAAAVAEVLTEPLRAVHASPLVRTQQSAEPLARAQGLTVDVRPGLEEVWAGDLEMASDRESVETYLGTLATWMRGDLDRRMPGGHDGHAFVERYDAAVRGLCRGHGPGDAVALFSHGDPIRSALMFYLGMPLDFVHRLEISPASVSIVTLGASGPQVLCANWSPLTKE